ncbi:aminotransferase class IV [Propionibacteriaceae bacterium Y1685]
MDSTSEWLHHKTTRRDVYESALSRHPEADDVVLINEHGRVTETCTANLAVRLDGQWWTPPLSDGCLPGVDRQRQLRAGTLQERPMSVAQVRQAEDLAVLNSLRGWRPARLEADPNGRKAIAPIH